MAQNNRVFVSSEIEEACRKMPSFKNNAFDVSELDSFLKSIDYMFTKEQIDSYERFYREFFHGKVPMDILVAGFAIYKDTPKLLRMCVVACDLDRDGFIDEGEFKVIGEVMLTHDPEFPRVDFTNFVVQADTNKDGKVSIDEAVDWFNKHVKK